MNRRKAILSQSAERFYQRIEKGQALPPSMQRGTPEYVKAHYWSTMNQRCVNGRYIQESKRNDAYLRKGVELLLTKAEFDEWVDQNWVDFERIYAEGKTPSIDRKDATKGYEPSNMQVIDLKENMRKDRVKPVIGTSIFTGEEIRFASAHDATGFDYKLISRSCLKGINHKGYAWRFAE